jgi:AraC-like DNA-binding protein
VEGFAINKTEADGRPSMGRADDLFSLDGNPLAGKTWIDTMYSRGLDCRLDEGGKASSMVSSWSAGELAVLSARLAWQRLSTNRQYGRSLEHVYLKVVRQGALIIENKGETKVVTGGGVVLVDPVAGFTDRYHESTQLTIISIPRYLLHGHEDFCFFPYPVIADETILDISAVRDCLVFALERTAHASEKIRSMLSTQCLGLIEILLESAQVTSRSQAPTAAAIAFRAKQAMHRLISAQDVNVDKIASEAAIPKHTLVRALKAEGLESPMRYIWSLRLDQAAQLLRRTPTMHVKEVAWRSGFTSAAHFSRMFRQRFGATPKEYAAHERESDRGAK